MLAVAGGAWSEMQAICIASVSDELSQSVATIGGRITFIGYPCEPNEECPPCITAALVADDGKTYYLSGLSEDWEHRLDSIISHPTNAMDYDWPLTAIVSGTPYAKGSYDYIAVSNIRLLSHEEIMLLDSWQVYKETVTAPTGNGAETSTFTRDVPNGVQYVFDGNGTMYEMRIDVASGWTHYSAPQPYTLEQLTHDTWLLTITGMYDKQPNLDGGCSPIILHKVTFYELQWEYQSYGGDEGPVTFYQYLRRPEKQPEFLPSLCDRWNVLFVRMGANGDELSTEIHRLTTDTIINGKTYVQLYIYGDYGVRDEVTYRGALREDDNANVYIVPANSDHEYLLYAFNAKVGDKLSNLWVGGAAETVGLPDGFNATVADITESSPRIFTLYFDYDVYEYHPIQWIEGVGLTDCPGGSICPGVLGCACSCGHILLCAYKDGKQVYASEEAERYGCWYDSNEQAGDTVKLYRHVNDGPGSSTVDPVDPNQIVVILQQDLLIMREYMGDEIQYTLQKSLAANAPAKAKHVQTNTFRGAASVQLTEDGKYRLDLTNPDWDYSIYGEFDYGKSSIEPVIHDAPAPKVIRTGHLLIQKGDKLYTLTGVEIE